MGVDDPMAVYQQFRSQLLQRYGMSGGGSEFGGQDPVTAQGGPAVDRNQQSAGRGTAPFNAHNMGVLASNTMGLMGGMGPVMTGATSIAEMGAGQTPGAWGGLQNFQGFRAIPPEKRRLIHNLVDLEHARSAAQGGALDSHGQVSGGGTGSKGGGLTQGGPR